MEKMKMGILRLGFRSVSDGFSRVQRDMTLRALSTNSFPGSGISGNQNSDSSESIDDFEKRIFGGISEDNSSSFFQKLDKLEKARNRSRLDSKFSGGNNSYILDGLDGGFNTLSDGMEGKLKKAATYFEFNPEEIERDDYTFRPDINFKPGMTYDSPKDLDLRKPGVWKPAKRAEFEVTTEEVLKKADFRNVRFLANFITEAGIIIKRSKTKISAKAQRRVAREIKTARAFGLMPFTTMGTKTFVFGQTMEDLDKDFEFDSYDSHVVDDGRGPLGG